MSRLAENFFTIVAGGFIPQATPASGCQAPAPRLGSGLAVLYRHDMLKVSARRAEEEFPNLLARVEHAGERIVICRNRTPVAEIRRPTKSGPSRQPAVDTLMSARRIAARRRAAAAILALANGAGVAADTLQLLRRWRREADRDRL